MKFVVEIPAEQEQAFKQAVEDCKGTCLIGSEDLVYEAIPVARIRRVLESVSYTHLDVYKRQPMKCRPSFSV